MNKICGILRSLSKMWAIRNTGIPSNIRSRVNPLLANGPILYPMKTPGNQRFSVFWGDIKWEHWLEMD